MDFFLHLTVAITFTARKKKKANKQKTFSEFLS